MYSIYACIYLIKDGYLQINPSSASRSPTAAVPKHRCPPAWDTRCFAGLQSLPGSQGTCSAACPIEHDPADGHIFEPGVLYVLDIAVEQVFHPELTSMFVVWPCLQRCPEKGRRMVEHPKSHRAQVPSALTSTLELLKSLWATGGLCTSARKGIL